jgi:hypothetical protein
LISKCIGNGRSLELRVLKLTDCTVATRLLWPNI